MNLEEMVKDVQDGWIYQGRSSGNKFVLVGPFFLNEGLLAFQVRVERVTVTEGTASDAVRVFSGLITGEPTKLAHIRVHKIDA